jgi:hypothetical protein
VKPARWRRELLAGIAPWMVFSLGRLAGYPAAGAGCAALAWLAVRGPSWRETKVFELAVLLFLAIAALAPPWLGRAELLLPGLLGVMALISVAAGRPCTLQYARLMTGPEWWHNRHFIAVNRRLTLLWGSGFLLAAGLALVSGPLQPLPAPAARGLQLGLYAGLLWYTRVYPRWYRLHQYLPLVRSGQEPYLKAPPHYRWPSPRRP